MLLTTADTMDCETSCLCCMCGCGTEASICHVIPNGGPTEPYCCVSDTNLLLSVSDENTCLTTEGKMLTIYNSKCTAVAVCSNHYAGSSNLCQEIVWPLIFLSCVPFTILLLLVVWKREGDQIALTTPQRVIPEGGSATDVKSSQSSKSQSPNNHEDKSTEDSEQQSLATWTPTLDHQVEVAVDSNTATRDAIRKQLSDFRLLQREGRNRADVIKSLESQHEGFESNLEEKSSKLHAAEDKYNIHTIRIAHNKSLLSESQQALSVLQETLSTKRNEQLVSEAQKQSFVSLSCEIASYILPALSDLQNEAGRLLEQKKERTVELEKLRQSQSCKVSEEKSWIRKAQEMIPEIEIVLNNNRKELVNRLQKNQQKEEQVNYLQSQVTLTEVLITKEQQKIINIENTKTELSAESISLQSAFDSEIEVKLGAEKNATYHKQHNNLISTLRLKEQDYGLISVELAQLVEEKKRLLQQLSNTECDFSHLKSSWESKQIDLQSTKQQIIKASDSLEQIKKEVDIGGNAITKLAKKVKSRKIQKKSYEEEKSKAVMQLQGQSQILTDAQGTITDLENQIQSLYDSISSLRPESHTLRASEHTSHLEIEITRIKKNLNEGVLQHAFRSAEFRELEKKHNLAVDGLGAELRAESQRRIDIHKQLINIRTTNMEV